MIVNKIIYLLSESLRSIRRSILPSIIASVTIAASLVVLSVSYFLYNNVKIFTTDLKDEYKIEVFFENDLNLEEALDTFNNILLIDGVEEGRFIDKENAAAIFKEEFDEDVINIIGSNPLPFSATYGVSMAYKSFSFIDGIVKKINQLPNIDEAVFPSGSINKFDKISRNILSFSFLLGLFIMFISLFFISNTIMLIVYSKKNEIKTMELLGASRIFIKTPYLFEGSLLGLLGGCLSVIIIFWLYKVFIYIIDPIFIISSSAYYYIIAMNLIFGTLLGLVGSSRALASSSIK